MGNVGQKTGAIAIFSGLAGERPPCGSTSCGWVGPVMRVTMLVVAVLISGVGRVALLVLMQAGRATGEPENR